MADEQYLQLVQDVLAKGNKRETRNGHTTISLFGTRSEYGLSNNKLPLLTTKKMFTKAVVEELIWFLSGSTDSKVLESKGVNIWKGHTSREFLDSRGLTHLEEGKIGKGYGYQWRGGNGEGVDQISEIIQLIKTDPTSRRIILNSWNVNQLHDMALPPCHILAQFYVDDNKLTCQLYQRSGDVALGVPFNITSYALLTHLIANECGLEADKLIHVIGDAHIYEPHVQGLQEQLQRVPFEPPKVIIDQGISIFDIKRKNIHIKGYFHYEPIRFDFLV